MRYIRISRAHDCGSRGWQYMFVLCCIGVLFKYPTGILVMAIHDDVFFTSTGLERLCDICLNALSAHQRGSLARFLRHCNDGSSNWGSGCSGTGSPAYIYPALEACFKRTLGVPLVFHHQFAAELCPRKQRFIMQPQPGLKQLFGDISGFLLPVATNLTYLSGHSSHRIPFLPSFTLSVDSRLENCLRISLQSFPCSSSYLHSPPSLTCWIHIICRRIALLNGTLEEPLATQLDNLLMGFCCQTASGLPRGVGAGSTCIDLESGATGATFACLRRILRKNMPTVALLENASGLLQGQQADSCLRQLSGSVVSRILDALMILGSVVLFLFPSACF